MASESYTYLKDGASDRRVRPTRTSTTPLSDRGGKDHSASSHISKTVLSIVKKGPPLSTLDHSYIDLCNETMKIVREVIL